MCLLSELKISQWIKKKLQCQVSHLPSVICIVYLAIIIFLCGSIPAYYRIFLPWESQYVTRPLFPLDYIKGQETFGKRVFAVASGRENAFFVDAVPGRLHGVLPIPLSLAQADRVDLVFPPYFPNTDDVTASETGAKKLDFPQLEMEDLSEEEQLKRMGIVGGFNVVGSDKVILDRDVPDSRPSTCRRYTYNTSNFPDASVIILSCNEHFSILMRTIHAVLNYSPPDLLKEIILVIDFCAPSADKMEEELQMIHSHALELPKVKVIAATRRLGIVQARLTGISASTAAIFVIMDAHVEPSTYWLEPLIYTLIQKDRTFAVPHTEVIDANTYQHQLGGIQCTTGMSWAMEEKSFKPNSKEPNRYYATPSALVTTPVISGNIFAAKRTDFEYFGKSDSKLKSIGSENLELSFRIWMCGGAIVCVPCSVVYQMYRSLGPQNYPVDEHTLLKNKLRVMAGWMGPYADIVWNFIGRPRIDYGDISEYSDIRDELECHSFQWYLKNVWPESDILDIKKDVPYLGKIKNLKSKLCLHLIPRNHVKYDIVFAHCSNAPEFAYFAKPGHIRPLNNVELCMEHTNVRRMYVSFEQCSDSHQTPTQSWVFDGSFGTISSSFTRQCIGYNKTVLLTTSRCEKTNANQLWSWNIYQPSLVWKHK